MDLPLVLLIPIPLDSRARRQNLARPVNQKRGFLVVGNK